MQCAIVAHVIAVRVPPLSFALATLNPVRWILREFAPVIGRASLALALFRGADDLIRTITGRLEGLLAKRALSKEHKFLILRSLPGASDVWTVDHRAVWPPFLCYDS